MPPKRKPRASKNATENTTTKKPPKKKAKWTSSNDAILVETLKTEQAKGNQSDNGWKASVWTACEKALAGSEVKTSSGVKNAKGCQDRWSGQVSISDIPCHYPAHLLIYFLASKEVS